jgi:protein ImuA
MQAIPSAEIESLRARIAEIERRPSLAGAALSPAARQQFLSTPPGALHEVFASEPRDGGASLGFTLGQARLLLTTERPAVLFIQLANDGQELGLPYGAGLASRGFPPRQLVIAQVQTIVELLWGIEEAVACRAVAAVVADISTHSKVLDFTASRRLSLRAGSSGASVFMMRYGNGREASAAQYRWQVAPLLSATRPFDPRAPGEVRWRVTLEKGRLAADGRVNWILGWTENGFELADTPKRKSEPVARPALHGAVSAQMGNRFA